MRSEIKRVIPKQRLNTDKSLKHERDTSDLSLEQSLKETEKGAEEVLSQSREETDSQRAEARQETEQANSVGKKAQASMEKGWALEDQAIRSERESTDEVLRRERQEYLRKIKEIIPDERKKTDRFLQSERLCADKALGSSESVLAMVSHDLRSHLGAILLSVDVLKSSKYNPNPKAFEDETSRIVRNAGRMAQLVNDLVDISSIEAGKLEMHLLKHEVSTVMQEAVGLFQRLASEKGIKLGLKVPSGLFGTFDDCRILQVLSNLISNAIKFTPVDGEVFISAEAMPGQILFKVRDSGRGIPEEECVNIFEQFWRADSNDHRGIGLGLYICKYLVEAHQGTINVESKVGKGSTFSFIIPDR